MGDRYFWGAVGLIALTVLVLGGMLLLPFVYP